MRDADQCRTEASRYRALARSAQDEWAARSLIRIAEAYEEEARRLERQPAPNASPAID
jgi:hypothetical protein